MPRQTLPDIASVAEFIDKLGGTMQVSAFLAVIPSAVSNAKAANHIPEAWRYRLSRRAKEMGVSAATFERLLQADERPLSRKPRQPAEAATPDPEE